MKHLLALLLLLPLLNGCAAMVLGGAAVGAGAGHDRRSFGTVLDDQAIELAAYDALNRDKELALQNNVEVVVHNGVLLLIGEMATEALKMRAESKVQDIQGVKRLVNEIAISERAGAISFTRDKYLTARVKTGMLDIVDMPDFDPSRVNVTTQRGVVYLMGLVSREEAERVVTIARGIPGVERVTKVFEYTN